MVNRFETGSTSLTRAAGCKTGQVLNRAVTSIANGIYLFQESHWDDSCWTPPYVA